MAKMKGVPAHVRIDLQRRLDEHARREHGSRVRELVLAFRAGFVYVDAVVDDPDPELARIRLFRLRYTGQPDAWRFAFYKDSDERYEPSVGMTGSFLVTPEEAFDCAAFAYLR